MERIQLTTESFLDILSTPTELLSIDFHELWTLHPEEQGSIVIYGKSTPTLRYARSYGVDYVFSGVRHVGYPIPGCLDPLKSLLEMSYGFFDQVLVNWYTNGHHYIGSHSDNEPQIRRCSPIVSVSLGATRKFRIRDISTKQIVYEMMIDLSLLWVDDFKKSSNTKLSKFLGVKVYTYPVVLI